MELPKYKIALIVGAGEGLSASLARLFAREGIKVALAARITTQWRWHKIAWCSAGASSTCRWRGGN